MNKIQAIILACSIALCACSPEQTNQQSGNTDVSPAATEKAKARCMNTLHHVSNRDDLISQMFQTALEDDCLYHFTSAELEKIWGIPVFDYVLPADGTDFSKPLNKDIESSIGLYIEKETIPAGASFYIEMTLSELNQHFSIFPEGSFPSILPKPKSYALPEAALRHAPAYLPPYQSPPQAKIKAGRTYYWFKDNRSVSVTSRVGEAMLLWFTNFRSHTVIADDSLAKADHSE